MNINPYFLFVPIFILSILNACIPVELTRKQLSEFQNELACCTPQAEFIVPEIKTFVPIKYPSIAKREKIEGTVSVRLKLTALGYVYSVDIIQSIHPLLDRAVYQATKKWTYWPETISGECPQVIVEHTFKIPRTIIRPLPEPIIDKPLVTGFEGKKEDYKSRAENEKNRKIPRPDRQNKAKDTLKFKSLKN